ncbi:MAG: hypothetical protein IPM29_05515 [Planctomycetes bacterium]|nr:hypothetical protein [Planctomycetota bacterium]
MLALAAALASASAARAQLTFTLGTDAVCSVASKPPLLPPSCGGTQVAQAGTLAVPWMPIVLRTASTASPAAIAELDVRAGDDVLTLGARVRGSSPTQTEARAIVSDPSGSGCGSGFPFTIWIDPPPCPFDLVVDASNSGGGGLDGDETSIEVRDFARSVLFQWRSSVAGQRGSAPTAVIARPGRTGPTARLLLEVRAQVRATSGSGPLDRSCSVTVRVVPRAPACAFGSLASGCSPRLLRQVRCDRTVAFSVFAPNAPPGSTVFLLLGFPAAPLPVPPCVLHLARPEVVWFGQLAASPVLSVPAFVAPAGAAGVFQAAVVTPALQLSLSDARTVQC